MPIRLAVAAVVTLIALAGCAMPPNTFEGDQWSLDRLDPAPEDFTLDLVLRRGDGVAVTPEVQSRELRMVLMPNGALHARIEDSARRRARRTASPLNDLPPPVRTLDRVTVASVWTRLEALGFSDPDAGIRPTDAFSVPVPESGRTSVLTIAGNERRWSFVRTAEDGVLDAEIIELSRMLADLAWAADDLGPQRRVVPRRYDLGGDPYARYRR